MGQISRDQDREGSNLFHMDIQKMKISSATMVA